MYSHFKYLSLTPMLQRTMKFYVSTMKKIKQLFIVTGITESGFQNEKN